MFCIALSSDVVMRAVCLHFVIICGESLIMRRCGEAAESGGGTSPQRKWSEQEVTVGNKERDGRRDAESQSGENGQETNELRLACSLDNATTSETPSLCESPNPPLT